MFNVWELQGRAAALSASAYQRALSQWRQASAALQPARHLTEGSPAQRLSPRVVMDLVALSDVFALGLAAAMTGLWHSLLAIEPAGNPLVRLELCLVAIGVMHFALRQQGDYAVRRPCQVRRGPVGFALQFALVLGAVVVVAMALGSPEVWPVTWLPVWWALSVAFVGLAREGAQRWVAAKHASGAFASAIAIYGAGRIADQLAEHAQSAGSGITITGIYDDRTVSGRAAPRAEGPTLSGTLEDLIRAGREDRIDEIVIALPPAADGRLASIMKQLEHLPVSLHVVTHVASDFVAAGLEQHRVSALGSVGLLDVKAKPMADWAPVVKRVQDLLIAVPALLFFTPVLIAIAIAIKWDSPGPVFFRQRRHGVNHHVFQVLKFRSMRVAEDGADVKQASKDDPRVTRVGAFLRKTSLDELPQLVKPGLTGWAQINGFRGETLTPDAMRLRVEHDLWYIDHWSLLLDLRILALTPIYGFTHRNAY
jgi:lipopolysaccharide/colanic/teichoic acid biosynthesis glycosyltransferase